MDLENLSESGAFRMGYVEGAAKRGWVIQGGAAGWRATAYFGPYAPAIEVSASTLWAVIALMIEKDFGDLNPWARPIVAKEKSSV